MGPPRRAGHPGVHRPGHRRPAARPRRPVEPHHRIPGPAGHGRAGLAGRHPPPAHPHHLGPGPGRCRPGHPRRPAHPQPAQPDPQPRRHPGTPRPHPPASKTIRAACPTTRKPSACTSGSAPAPRKPTWRSPSATPTWTSLACGTWARPNAGTSTASPTGPTATPSAAPKPWEAWATSPTSGSVEARAAGEPEPVLLAHLNTALDRLPAGPGPLPRRRRRRPRHHPQPARHHLRPGGGHPAGPAPLPAIHRATRRPAATPTAPGRPASTSPSSSQATAGRADALLYARAALSDFEKVGPGAAQDAAQTRDLITRLEHDSG